MKYPKLDERLFEIANLVDKGSVICDIGTDHGYLPVFLVNTEKSKKAYACDIGEKPLNQAKNTIMQYNASDKVKTILSNGFDNIHEEILNKIDTVILAGMGGELIFEIINRADFLKKNKIKIIAQPMTNHHVFRKNLYASGFFIEKEKLVYHNEKIYSIMVIGYNGIMENLSDVFINMGKVVVLDNDLTIIKMYINNIVKKNITKINGIKLKNVILENDILQIKRKEKLTSSLKKILSSL